MMVVAAERFSRGRPALWVQFPCVTKGAGASAGFDSRAVTPSTDPLSLSACRLPLHRVFRARSPSGSAPIFAANGVSELLRLPFASSGKRTTGIDSGLWSLNAAIGIFEL
jgi:hypothetical protein